ncbi:MAG: leucyl aminopeptidase [Gammaproteobacteria bacterium]|jgi:leucyl aminopeptidase|nr:leucyl aminopeptidase [Gammaproteobacteria bacterium]
MNFTLSTEAPQQIKSDCLIIPLFKDAKPKDPAAKLPAKVAKILTDSVQLGNINNDCGQINWLFDIKECTAPRLLVVGLGPLAEFTAEKAVTALQAAVSALLQKQYSSVALALDGLACKAVDEAQWIQRAALAFKEKTYQFNTFKTKTAAKKPTLKSISFCVDKAGVKSGQKTLDYALALAEGMSLVKDLGNTPANHCTPSTIAQTAQAMGKKYAKVTTTVLSVAEMKKLGMNAILAVGQGSRHEPKLVIVEYKGGKKSQAPIALVGKGITFDTGGISIKPPGAMDEMKYDMCGAATVLGAIQVAASLNLPINLVALAACAENMPGGNAIKPGDIITTLSGQTVEILNTDAEGRLVLCDALTYCARYKPEVILDFATLTGAMVVALGTHTSGFFTNDENLATALSNAAKNSLDSAWRMPLIANFKDDLKSNFADLANIAPHRWGGAIEAAVFLAQFTEGQRWAHFDIAGTAWTMGANKGATARPLPLLMEYLCQYAYGKR